MMKIFSLPLSWLFGAITWLRNKLFDYGIFTSYHSSIPSIVIGNLQVGGSGKTPMCAFLFHALSSQYKVSILSRGYGRKTKGIQVADKRSTADTIGDEPLWYYQTLNACVVLVSEKRKIGLQYLEKTATNLVLLDDAFQHRAIKGSIEIMLSDYSTPYYKDYPMPFGRMREYRTGDKRADIIIMSKCPNNLSLLRKVDIIQKIHPMDHQTVFFTGLNVGKITSLKGDLSFDAKQYNQAIVMSGIANSDSFIHICKQIVGDVIDYSFKDHYDYSKADIKKLNTQIQAHTVVFITEKDAVKLRSPNLYDLISENSIYIVPINFKFLFNVEVKFLHLIQSKLKQFSNPKE